MAVPFRFEAVLKVREAERDRCRWALAQEQQREADLLVALNLFSTEREAIQNDLRAMQAGESWSVERALVCEQRTQHLANELGRIQIDLLEINLSLQRCHRELLEADTAVKALEKLAAIHEADQRRGEQAQDERDREDHQRAA